MPSIFLELRAFLGFLIFSSRWGHVLIQLSPILNYSTLPLVFITEAEVPVSVPHFAQALDLRYSSEERKLHWYKGRSVNCKVVLPPQTKQ